MKFSESDTEFELKLKHLTIAGWTGRDSDAVNHHIQELAQLGVDPPSRVPLYYRVSAGLLTQSTTIQVLGPDTSGEVEPLLLQGDGHLWLGLASDHTDRKLEEYSVAASKQACLKPVSKNLWSYNSVKDHLDELVLQCEIQEQGRWITYQKGKLENIRPLAELMSGAAFEDEHAMLCGTLSAIGGVRPASHYRMRLIDPELERTLELDYAVSSLPLIS